MMPNMNHFFHQAAQTNPEYDRLNPVMPRGDGMDLGMLIAMEMIQSNPQLRRQWELQLQKLLVPRSAPMPSQGSVDSSVANLLAQSQMGMGMR